MLYEMQRERVKIDVAIEKKLKKTFPSLSQDIRILKELLDDLDEAQKSAHNEEPLKNLF